MDTSRKGMTLFELLIVMMIIGVVYSIAVFTVNKEKLASSKTPLSGLKTALNAIEHTGSARLVCDELCRECRVLSNDDTPIATLQLISDGNIRRFGFDRYGDLKPIDKSLVRIQDSMKQSCFEFTLYPDHTTSALILKDNTAFYAYTPLQGDKPFITSDPDVLRRFMFDERRYPLREDHYYVGQ